MRTGRVVFAGAWIALQAALILTAGQRPDGAFGFRMFSESSTMQVALFRETATGQRIHVEDGTWSARDQGGNLKRFSWYDRVWPVLGVFDRDTPAGYGEAAQLVRLQGALDDVAANIPDDAETKRLVLEVTVHRNGHEPHTVTLTSKERR